MTVDFNNLRVNALVHFDRLTGQLNSSIKEKDYYPTIVIDPEEIRVSMEHLRSILLTIACLQMKDNPDFKDVSNETQVDCFFPLDQII
jgi:hypothetical protein